MDRVGGMVIAKEIRSDKVALAPNDIFAGLT
jgi:hypothetical protein